MAQFGLLRERRFGPFFATQFLGAFNDNVFKNALIILIAFGAADAIGLDSNVLVNLSAGLFILPFFLFSASAGQIADRYEKSMLIRRIKLAEIAIMALAAAAFLLDRPLALIAVLFLMGTQSAFFGPIKYAILPQHLAEEELVGGNGMVEMGTFVAILLGTLAGGVLIAVPGAGPALVSATVLAVAVAGWWTSRGIPVAPAVAPGLAVRWNLLAESWRIVDEARANRTVFLSMLGISWFWLYGATFLAQLPNFTKEVLGGDERVVTVLLATFSLGIGIGSLACERLSGRKVEIGLVPFGAIGLSVFALDLGAAAGAGAPPAALAGPLAWLAEPRHWRVLADLALLAVSGGLFIVPLYALIQQRSEPERRSRVIAANNILNALFMVVSALLAIALLSAGLGIVELFLVVAVMNAVVAWFIFRLVPEFLLRFVVWLLVHSIYRLETREVLERIPEEGPAVLVCNHVTFVDALVIMAACRRPIRFVTYHRVYDLPVLRFVFRTSRAIPIAPRREDPERLERAYDEIARALEAGELIGLFPEGGVTGDGEIGEFRPGIERIVARTPVPVVPLALRGLWGSFFSRKDAPAMSRPLRLLTRLRSRVELVAGEPVPPAAVSAARLREQVVALCAGAA